MPVDLNALLLDLTGLTDAEIEKLGRTEYARLYLCSGGRGSLRAYDGSEVVFFEDRFEHAFFTTADRYRHQFAKNVIARDRVARIGWIGPIIKGEAPNTQCWEFPPGAGKHARTKRLCIASSELFVVWLEPRGAEGWKFSTAYVARAEQASAYKHGGRTLWKV